MLKNDNFKQILYNFYEKHEQRGRKYIRDHFIELGVTERTLDRWLTILESNQTLGPKKSSRSTCKGGTKVNIRNLKIHCRFHTKKFTKRIECSQPNLSNIPKKDTSLFIYKNHIKLVYSPTI